MRDPHNRAVILIIAYLSVIRKRIYVKAANSCNIKTHGIVRAFLNLSIPL